ncbi:hypothetical protein PIROE2DRAFT_17096 [Piromyces sp. E2]|nr:hypothetical protein PIROE2DRAFT_17096 [Piromyces sp. E2]|eukprot:OUM57807.1 hypothetical protein PIROE2DRAFT_17096 [Piromyces sp. E2]
MENTEEFDKLYQLIKSNYRYNGLFLNNILNKNVFKKLNEEDILVCLYIVIIDEGNLKSLVELNNLFLNETNNIDNNSPKDDTHSYDQETFDFIYHIYKRNLLTMDRLKKIISLENYIKIEITCDMIILLLQNQDTKLLKILYQNFSFNNTFIKNLLYCYRCHKNKNVGNERHLPHSNKVLPNSLLQRGIIKEMNKIDFNRLDKNQVNTPLIYACKHNNENMVAYLIEQGVDLNKENRIGNTSIFYACLYGNENIFKALIKNGVNFNKKNKNGQTPLIYACYNKNEYIIKALIKNGAYIHKEFYTNEASLFFTSLKINANIINILVNVDVA